MADQAVTGPGLPGMKINAGINDTTLNSTSSTMKRAVEHVNRDLDRATCAPKMQAGHAVPDNLKK